jgi:hypothetical protein
MIPAEMPLRTPFDHAENAMLDATKTLNDTTKVIMAPYLDPTSNSDPATLCPKSRINVLPS